MSHAERRTGMVAGSDIDRIADALYAESSDDLIGLWEVVKLAQERSTGGNALLEQSLGIVEALLSRGLLAGDPPYSPGGYKPWPDQGPQAVLRRIQDEWLALGRNPNIPDIAWFGRDTWER